MDCGGFLPRVSIQKYTKCLRARQGRSWRAGSVSDGCLGPVAYASGSSKIQSHKRHLGGTNQSVLLRVLCASARNSFRKNFAQRRRERGEDKSNRASYEAGSVMGLVSRKKRKVRAGADKT